MLVNDKFFYINIRDYLALGNDNKAGEPMLTRVLSGFSCPKNPDVERFLKNSSVEFTKKSQSVTYLVQHFLIPHTLSTRYLRHRRVVVSQQCHRIASFLRLALTKISSTKYMGIKKTLY